MTKAVDPPPSCWPPDGSRVDRLDKQLSAPLLRLQLGLPLEVLLSVPGCWFGMPAVLSITPIAVSIASSSALPGSRHALLACGIFASLLAAWFRVLTGNVRVALALFSMPMCLFGPLVGKQFRAD